METLFAFAMLSVSLSVLFPPESESERRRWMISTFLRELWGGLWEGRSVRLDAGHNKWRERWENSHQSKFRPPPISLFGRHSEGFSFHPSQHSNCWVLMPCNMQVLMIGKIIQEQKMILAKKKKGYQQPLDHKLCWVLNLAMRGS